MALTFDGPSLEIVLDAVSINYTAQEIYSRWKDWVLDTGAVNAKWPPAFRVVGGDDLGGSTAPAFYFVRNDLGWTIKKPEATIDVRVNGNLVFEDPAGTRFTEPDGAYNPTIEIFLSQVAPVDLSTIQKYLERLYIAHFHKRSHIGQITTLMDTDGTTPLFTFDAPNDGTLIDPRFDPTID